MSLSEFLLGPGEFKSADQVVGIVEKTSAQLIGEKFSQAKALPIFKTSKQQTWLVATNKRLICVLEDIPRSFTRVQWAMTLDTIMSPIGEFLIPIRTRQGSDGTNRLDVGSRQGWLYSKRLFEGKTIEDSIRDLLRDQMSVQS